MTFIRPRCFSAAVILGVFQGLCIYNTTELWCGKGYATGHPACYMALGLQAGYHARWLYHLAKRRVVFSFYISHFAQGMHVREGVGGAALEMSDGGEAGTRSIAQTQCGWVIHLPNIIWRLACHRERPTAKIHGWVYKQTDLNKINPSKWLVQPILSLYVWGLLISLR